MLKDLRTLFSDITRERKKEIDIAEALLIIASNNTTN